MADIEIYTSALNIRRNQSDKTLSLCAIAALNYNVNRYGRWSTCPTATMRVDMDSVMDSVPRACRCHQARREEGVTWQLVLQDCAVAAVTQLRLPADDMEHVSLPGRLVMHHDSHKQ
jgi:hypothetical protein